MPWLSTILAIVLGRDNDFFTSVYIVFWKIKEYAYGNHWGLKTLPPHPGSNASVGGMAVMLIYCETYVEITYSEGLLLQWASRVM